MTAHIQARCHRPRSSHTLRRLSIVDLGAKLALLWTHFTLAQGLAILARKYARLSTAANVFLADRRLPYTLEVGVVLNTSSSCCKLRTRVLKFL